MIYINSKNKFKLNKNNAYILIDFDKTITCCEGDDSWAAVANPKIVGKEIKNDIDKLYEKYRPIEMDYNISKQEKLKQMEIWYSECMNLYYNYKLTKNKIEESIKSSNIKFRKGVKELLISLHKQNVPVIILSAGIGNTIEQFLKTNNCYFDDTMYIISNFIEFDRKGNVKKFDNSKIIHSLNKNINVHLPDKFKKKIRNKKYKILLGDLIEDTKMVDKDELNTTLTIGILTKEMESEENLKLYNTKFDIVLTDEENLREVVKNLIEI